MSRYPNTDVGEEGTADLLTAMLDDITVKAGSLGRPSTTTAANDDELVNIAMTPGTWYIECLYYVTGETAGGSDFKVQWAFTGTTTGTPIRSIEGPVSSSTAAANAITTTVASRVNYTTANTYGLGGTLSFVIHEYCTSFVVATAGNFSVQWAQGTSHATATTLQAGSMVKMRQIA